MEKPRNHWLTALIATLFSPAIGMCFVNRGQLALLYLALMLIPSIAALFVPIDFGLLERFAIAVTVFGVAHAFIIAKRKLYPLPYRWYARLPGLVAMVLLFGGFILFNKFAYELVRVPSAGMAPAIPPQSMIAVSKASYKQHPPARGDMVVFMHSDGNLYVKRIMGLPGETVQMRDGLFLLEGVAFKREELRSVSAEGKSLREYRETNPEGIDYNIWEMGDVSESDNTSRIEIPSGSYFVMGDNRDNSRDSRFENFGLVPSGNITGKAIVLRQAAVTP